MAVSFSTAAAATSIVSAMATVVYAVVDGTFAAVLQRRISVGSVADAAATAAAASGVVLAAAIGSAGCGQCNNCLYSRLMDHGIHTVRSCAAAAASAPAVAAICCA